ncbi:SRPBCC family protein [Nonomuraea sp. NPDC051191]|uniref:SRPBCC family protein n=1 Tax=Nonomuraea sp. NPDC051191 TaxID=3364372 RepID=UPI00379C90BF
MATTSVSRVLPASPERVWDLIGGFHALPDWLPYIPESTMLEGGRVRRLTNPDGEVIVERLMDFSEAERHYTYAIVEAPFQSQKGCAVITAHPF